MTTASAAPTAPASNLPPGYVRFSVYMPAETLAAAEAAAQEARISRNAAINRLVHRGLADWSNAQTDTHKRLAATEEVLAQVTAERDALRRQLQPDLRLGQVLKTGAILRFPVPEYLATAAARVLRQDADAAQRYAMQYLPAGPRREEAMRAAGATLQASIAFEEMAGRYRRPQMKVTTK